MQQSPEARVTLLIVAWNHADLLERCLTSVRHFHPNIPIVVVDNGSTPRLTLSPDITLVRSETNLGFAGGNNLGFQYCKTAFTLLLNSDTQLTSAITLKQLLDFADAHPKAALMQAQLQLADGQMDACGEFLTQRGVLYHHGYRQPFGPHVTTAFRVYAAKAACCLVRNATIPTVGNTLFRNDYFCYGEDLELAHRMWLVGHEVWYVPTAPVLHLEGATAKSLPSRTVWQHYLNNLWTTACDYWSPWMWRKCGVGLGMLLIAAFLFKGVWPHRRSQRLYFKQNVADEVWVPNVFVRISWRYCAACLRRNFTGMRFTLPSSTKETL